MGAKDSGLTVTDQFCGAGGSSQGAKKALDKVGGKVKLALNHWKLAIETHNTNFPDTLHDCTDISACDPRRYPSTDILLTSPECTTHSPAGGNNHRSLKKQMELFEEKKIDPATERSRATMWDVCRFSEYHNYNIIVVENVVEALTKWALFDVWIMAMNKLGYNHRLVFHNSMHHHPTPQSRDRMYVVFWKRGNRAPMLDYTPSAHCPKCNKNVHAIQTWKDKQVRYGKYRKQYVYCCPECSTIIEPYYYASFNCIDWSDSGGRIGDRKLKRCKCCGEKRLMACNSERRVRWGLNKYGATPIGVTSKYTTGVDCRVWDMTIGTLPTQPIGQSHNILLPFTFTQEHTKGDPSGYVTSVNEVINTQTTTQAVGLLQHPFIVENKGNSNARSIFAPLATQTCKGSHGLIMDDAWQSFIGTYYGAGGNISTPLEPLDTLTVKHRHFLSQYKTPEFEECYYRMLKPEEIKLAMAFDSKYQVLGNIEQQVKQLGNAVTPPAMEWLVERCIESLS